MLTMREEFIFNLKPYLRIFREIGLDVEFITPTETMQEKSILDAIIPVRNFFKRNKLHDYEKQANGKENKVLIDAFFVNEEGPPLKKPASLYRSKTRGDRRFRVSDLKYNCNPGDLLALVTDGKSIYIINLSLQEIHSSLFSGGHVYNFLKELSEEEFMHENKLDPREFIQKFDSKYEDSPQFETRIVKSIKRPSSTLSNKIKEYYGPECMICGYPGFEKRSGGKYAEVHHMIELNRQAPKSLQSWNVIVVCPTCHRKLHYNKAEVEFLNPGWKINIDGKEINLKD